MNDELPPGQIAGPGGHVYMVDHKDRMVRLELVKEQDLLRDRMVRELHARAEALSAEIRAFVQAGFGEVDAFNDLLAEKYDAKSIGKGNQTLTTYDGRLRVLVQVQDRVVYGPELQVAKSLLDEFLTRITTAAAASAEAGQDAADVAVLQAIVLDAFQVDQAGKVNRGALLRLKRHKVEDPLWIRAMQAITDSEQPDGTKTYIRFQKRADPEAPWTTISLDAATA